METIKSSGAAQALEGRRDGQVEDRASQGQGNDLRDTIMVDTHRYTFVQTHRMDMKNKSQCKLWIWVGNNASV